MEKENKPQKKFINFRGRNYIAMKELSEKACAGCALIDKHCYKHEMALSICRKGYIFRPASEVDDINPLDY